MARGLLFFFLTYYTRSVKYTIQLLTALLAVTALGQTGNSTISGSVKDPAAAAIPGAKIKITNVESGATIESVSNEAGLYRRSEEHNV